MKRKTKIIFTSLFLGIFLLAAVYYFIFGDLPNIASLPEHLNQPAW